MAVEAKRDCGYRVVGGLYLVGTGLVGAQCDRLPMLLEPCPTCGEVPRFNRAITLINPAATWGQHSGCKERRRQPCPLCSPPEKGYIMWVGAEYTPTSFIKEARALGVSKRIRALPSDMVLGEDWVYLAYQKLIPAEDKGFVLPLETLEHRRGFRPGIFYVFRPEAAEYIATEPQAQDGETVARLREKGIMAVIVPDDDPDHNPQGRRRAPATVGKGTGGLQ